MSQNCTMNWWGSANSTEIRSRIKDKYQDPSVGEVIYQPFLSKSEFSCEGVNSCSGHGLCIAPDVCQCSSGWEGSSCSNYSCSRVYNCLGRGDCVGPDKCLCKNGWTGQDCSVAGCSERSNCSGRGICVRPNEYANTKSVNWHSYILWSKFQMHVLGTILWIKLFGMQKWKMGRKLCTMSQLQTWHLQ